MSFSSDKKENKSNDKNSLGIDISDDTIKSSREIDDDVDDDDGAMFSMKNKQLSAISFSISKHSQESGSSNIEVTDRSSLDSKSSKSGKSSKSWLQSVSSRFGGKDRSTVIGDKSKYSDNKIMLNDDISTLAVVAIDDSQVNIEFFKSAEVGIGVSGFKFDDDDDDDDDDHSDDTDDAGGKKSKWFNM